MAVAAGKATITVDQLSGDSPDRAAEDSLTKRNNDSVRMDYALSAA